MTHRTLQAVLRKLADAGPPTADADLLRRFAADRDEAAFAVLVQRHGRLVWAVCRHLTRSDAEADDAFQATFLVLVRNAAKVRYAGRLSAWLHGVAYRVCSKARQTAKRRITREATAATPERNGRAVPDSAWDRALAAVHEEVAKLPDTLRVPFVLCCLEGKGQTEAAEQLGWKLGTLSGRLTRAKDAVLARLDARGLTLGAVAAVGLSAPPTAVMAKAAALVQMGFAVPGSILQLSQGVVGMSVNQGKLLAAGLLVACGLGLSAGSGWLASAGAQYVPPGMPPKPAERVKQLEEELAKAKREAAQAQESMLDLYASEVLLSQVARPRKEEPTHSTKKWDYDLVVVSGLDQTRFWKFLQEREDKGWEFIGTTPMKDPDQTVWVFRRPKAGTTTTTSSTGTSTAATKLFGTTTKPADATGTTYRVKPTDPAAKPGDTTSKPTPKSGEPLFAKPVKADDAAAIEVEIKKLQDRLATLRAKDAGKTWVMIDTTAENLDAELVGKLLVALGIKKYGSNEIQVLVTPKGVSVFGTNEVTDWAVRTVKKLGEK